MRLFTACCTTIPSQANGSNLPSSRVEHPERNDLLMQAGENAGLWNAVLMRALRTKLLNEVPRWQLKKPGLPADKLAEAL